MLVGSEACDGIVAIDDELGQGALKSVMGTPLRRSIYIISWKRQAYSNCCEVPSNTWVLPQERVILRSLTNLKRENLYNLINSS
jgi:hypothetical protein